MPELKFYEEYQIGEKQSTSGRTMTDADIRMFIGCSGSTHRLHTDREYCKKHPLVDDCILQGCLELGVMDGLMCLEVTPNKGHTMHYGYDKIRFLHPCYVNDTWHLETELIDKKDKNDEFGVITWNLYLKNQHGETCVFAVDKQLIGKRPKDEEGYKQFEE